MSAEGLKPLEGEDTIPSVAAVKPHSNTGRIIAIVGVMLTAMVVIGFGVAHFFRHPAPVIADKQEATKMTASSKAAGLRMPDPASAPSIPNPLTASATPDGAASRPAGTTVPDLAPDEGDAKAIPLHRAGTAPGQNGYTPASRQPKAIDPDDAPIFSGAQGSRSQQAATATEGTESGEQGTQGTARADDPSDPAAAASGRLSALQGQLGGLVQTLQHRMNGGTGGATNVATSAITLPTAGGQPKAGLFGTMEQSATPKVTAHLLGDRSMIVPKGTLFLCSLKTRVVSATSGFIGCQTERNVFSDDGKVLLLERGSHLDGEYRVVTIKPGVTRVPVLWTRIRTSKGVVVDLDSPATGQLGESGLDGYVDNRWGERLGAAILLSLIEDAIQYATTPANSTGNTNVVLPNTSTQGSKLAEKVLDTTINIPPLLYQNQGGVVGVYVAHDIDFSSVYELRPK